MNEHESERFCECVTKVENENRKKVAREMFSVDFVLKCLPLGGKAK